ncbi:hypothetical protein [Rhodococcus sp. USK13]|jgi:hypothetical protein|uniref:hypothetical protein n=1 Tax=Rhodococcus sp. USK13 TaxID=2806442 RepID=UPI001BCB40D9|nr:hypothetical protein [Rhodococcus sp. USK13]
MSDATTTCDCSRHQLSSIHARFSALENDHAQHGHPWPVLDALRAGLDELGDLATHHPAQASRSSIRQAGTS